MTSLLRWIRRLAPPAPPRVFANTNFQRLGPDVRVEEETLPDYLAARYYPVHIGQVFASRYQVVGKLGYGAYSTVWLARDLNQHRHVALKMFVRAQALGEAADDELNTYKHLASVSATSSHPGRDALRTLSDSFKVSGPDGEHQCLVHPPLWDSVDAFLKRNHVEVGRLPVPVLAIVLQRLFLALDFLHTECQLVHTDIRADNIMFGIDDDSVFEEFERDELEKPCPRKVLDDRIIYTSRSLGVPEAKRLRPPVLCDFGAVVSGKEPNDRDVQPDLYRAPEVMLGIPWGREIDIWNAGCMVWDIFEGRHMFSGRDPEHKRYRTRAHLASVISVLGLPPPELVARGSLSDKFFSDGNFSGGIELPPTSPLEETETSLEGDEKLQFLALMRKMMQWDPARRSTAKELLEDPWLKSHLS